MDSENSGYDVTVNFKSVNKEEVIKDIDDVAKHTRYTNDQLMAANMKRYEVIKKVSRRDANYTNTMQAQTNLLSNAAAANPRSVRGRDINSVRDKILSGYGEEMPKQAMDMLDQLDSVQKKVRDANKSVSKMNTSWTHHSRATRVAAVSYHKFSKAVSAAYAKTAKFRAGLSFVGKGLESIGGGLQRAGLWVVALATTFAYAANRIAKSLIAVGEKQESLARSSQLFFGSMENSYNAMAFAEDKLLSGKGAWAKSDIMQGMNALQSVGVDAKKNYQMIADMAGKSGKSFADTAQAVSSAIQGNSSALEGFGIQEMHLRGITNALRQNTPAMRGAILGFLANQKQFKGGAEAMASTITGLKTQLTGWKDMFLEAIVGKASDPNSLTSSVTNTFKHVTEALQRNKGKIQEIARGVGTILKWIWRQVDIIVHRVTQKLDNLNMAKFQIHVKNVIVWLELMKIRVARIFDEWGWAFKTMLEIWVGSKLVKAISFVGEALKVAWGFGKFLVGTLSTMVGWIVKMGNIISKVFTLLAGTSLAPALTAAAVLKPMSTGEGASLTNRNAEKAALDAKIKSSKWSAKRTSSTPTDEEASIMSMITSPEGRSLGLNSWFTGNVKDAPVAPNVEALLKAGYNNPKDAADYISTMDRLGTKESDFTIGSMTIHVGDSEVMDKDKFNNLVEQLTDAFTKASNAAKNRSGGGK